jgi:hypothetical protein
MSPNIFTIPPEKLPSKAFSITFKEPTFGDRREVTRRFPAGSRPGYTLEQMLLATSITAINGQDIEKGIPRDPTYILREMPQVDEQYLRSVFMSMFAIDDEQVSQTREIGLKLRATFSPQYTITRGEMPSHLLSVTFANITAGERMQLERVYPGVDSNCGYSFEEMLFASSITAVDGNPVEKLKPKDAITLLDSWSHLDAQFAISVYVNTVMIDREDAEDAKALGKSLRESLLTPSTSSVVSSHKKKTGATTSQSEEV